MKTGFLAVIVLSVCILSSLANSSSLPETKHVYPNFTLPRNGARTPVVVPITIHDSFQEAHVLTMCYWPVSQTVSGDTVWHIGLKTPVGESACHQLVFNQSGDIKNVDGNPNNMCLFSCSWNSGAATSLTVHFGGRQGLGTGNYGVRCLGDSYIPGVHNIF